MRAFGWKWWSFLHVLLLALLLAGCATTPRINWAERVGNYTYDQAILELGPPDKNAKLKDGTIVAEWLRQRGYAHSSYDPAFGFYPWYYGPYYPSYTQTYVSPDVFLRLIFSPDGRLQDYKKLYR